MKSILTVWVQDQNLDLDWWQHFLARMLSSMPAAKRVVRSDTVPALVLTKAEIAKAGS